MCVSIAYVSVCLLCVTHVCSDPHFGLILQGNNSRTRSRTIVIVNSVRLYLSTVERSQRTTSKIECEY